MQGTWCVAAFRFPIYFSAMTKIISWNLLCLTGASLADVVALIRRERPDLLLMQEATPAMDGLIDEVGGHYLRSPLPSRVHGLAVWSPVPLPTSPIVLPLPSGTMFDRVCQILDLGEFAVANVHLSHGQVLNRRQLRRIAEALPPVLPCWATTTLSARRCCAAFATLGRASPRTSPETWCPCESTAAWCAAWPAWGRGHSCGRRPTIARSPSTSMQPRMRVSGCRSGCASRAGRQASAERRRASAPR